MASFSDRVMGAVMLDAGTYEEVEADVTALGQAMCVVVLSSLAAGIGSPGGGGLAGIVLGTVGSLLAWFAWAGLTYVVGTQLLPEAQTRSDVGELLRTTGFSAAPGVLRVVGFVPVVGWLIWALSSVWMLVAMVVAVRQALDYRSTARAVGVCLIGFLIYLPLSLALRLAFVIARSAGAALS
jgi:hypothetical protein